MYTTSLNQRLGALLAVTTVLGIVSTLYVWSLVSHEEESHEALDAERNRKEAKRSKVNVGFDMLRVRIVKDHVVDDSGRSRNEVAIHFIRHGEGYHNVAQREWRADPKWDGKSEPYTLDNDPSGKYEDPLLTPLGRTQALKLQSEAKDLNPDVMIVSPLRRATETGLIAFDDHVKNRGLPVIANELAHETGGRHTCDRRLPKSKLQNLYPDVNYDLIQDEIDPLWGDGETRESVSDIADRAAKLLTWIVNSRTSESEFALATHSGFLNAMFVSVLGFERGWFKTGEMRTVVIEYGRSSGSSSGGI